MRKLDQILRKAQTYAQRNPDKVAKYADKRTKGKYSGQIDGALNKLDSFTGKERRRDDSGGGSW